MKDLPEEYLTQIYDEIAGNEIKMKASSSNALGSKSSKTGNTLHANFHSFKESSFVFLQGQE